MPRSASRSLRSCSTSRKPFGCSGANQTTRGALPADPYPESAARALGHAAAYGVWHARTRGGIPQLTDLSPEHAESAGTTNSWADSDRNSRRVGNAGCAAP